MMRIGDCTVKCNTWTRPSLVEVKIFRDGQQCGHAITDIDSCETQQQFIDQISEVARSLIANAKRRADRQAWMEAVNDPGRLVASTTGSGDH